MDDERARASRHARDGTEVVGQRRPNGAAMSTSCTRSVDCMADKRDVNRTIRRLVGVYNANGSVSGELVYFIGAGLGRAHCALCDITYGLVRERAAWNTFRVGLQVPFDLYHRDDQPADTRLATGGNVPVVLAETDDEYVAVLGPAELVSCGGSIEHFAHAIETAVTRVGLSWPS